MSNKYTIIKTEIIKKIYLFNGVIDENHNKDLCKYVIADNHEKAIEIAKELEIEESENFELDQVRGTEIICTEYNAIQLPKETK
jgi:hypothetical protein